MIIKKRGILNPQILIFKTIKIPQLPGFDNYLRIVTVHRARCFNLKSIKIYFFDRSCALIVRPVHDRSAD